MTVAAERARAAAAAPDLVDLQIDAVVAGELSAACELAATAVGVPSAVLSLLADGLLRQVAAHGPNSAPGEYDDRPGRTALADGADLCLSDASTDPRFAASPPVGGRTRIRSYSATVLRGTAGPPVGILSAFGPERVEVPAERLRALHIVGERIVGLLELQLRTRQLADSTAELSRSNERLAAFTDQVSHDLKAPITAILGFAELLTDLDTVAADRSAAAYVARCTSAARRMLAMVDDLRGVARAGGPTAVRRVALDTVMPALVEQLATPTGAAVTWSGPDLPADAAQLRELLRRLLSNALTSGGDAPPDIRVVSERVADDIELRVSDNRSATPPEGNTRAASEPSASSTVDLTVCARIMAAHGGTFAVRQTAGGGTSAVAVFPTGDASG